MHLKRRLMQPGRYFRTPALILKTAHACGPPEKQAESLDFALLTRKEKQTQLRESLITWGELT